MFRWLARVVAGVLCAAALALLPVVAVFAADGDGDGAGDGGVRFSVVPAGVDGKPDGRHWFDLVLAPGGSVVEHVVVKNLSGRGATFGLVAADGYFNRNGRYGMLADPAESVDAGKWIEVQSEVEVPAGGSVVVPFTVTVPGSVEPGDHAAGIAGFVVASDGAGVSVQARMGIKVMTRVPGQLEPAVSVQGVEARYRTVWNPLKPGKVTAGFDVVNTGNTRLLVKGTVQAGGSTVSWPASGDDVIELLPGGSRHIEVELSGVWPWFRVPVTVTVNPEAVATVSDVVPPVMGPVTAFVAVAALPLPHIFILFALALLIVAVVASRRASRRKVQGLIDQAVERTKQELAAPAETMDSAGAILDEIGDSGESVPNRPLTRKELRATTGPVDGEEQ